MGNLTPGEVVTAVFICLGVVGGALYGWAAAGTVVATVGGAVIIGILALLLASVFAMAAAGIAHLLRRGDDQ